MYCVGIVLWSEVCNILLVLTRSTRSSDCEGLCGSYICFCSLAALFLLIDSSDYISRISWNVAAVYNTKWSLKRRNRISLLLRNKIKVEKLEWSVKMPLGWGKFEWLT